MQNKNDKDLSDALLRALRAELHGPDEHGDRAPGAGDTDARRAQAGDAVLRTLHAWLQSDAAERDKLGERGTELREALEDVLSENRHVTQPGRRTPEASAAPRSRQAHGTGDSPPVPEPGTGPSPQLAEKLAAKLAAVAAVAAARDSQQPPSTPMFTDAPDPPTESQAVRPAHPPPPAPPPATAGAWIKAGEHVTPPAMPATPSARPTVVGDRYELITRVHQGGHTSVWRGIDTHAPAGGSAVAIKLIAEQHADALDEATIAALIDVSTDPGLMTLRASGHQDGWIYQVSEWIDGQTLESLLRSRADAMSFLADLPEWMRQLAHAIEALHDAGFVHGDLKPANVMICADDTAKLIDFDTLCRVGSTGAIRSLTPAFASPERRAGEPADTRDDVYSIAVIAYRLFTGELPHGGDGQQSDGKSQPAPVRPDGLDTLQWQALRRGLAVTREHRTPSVLELVNEIWETGRPSASAAKRRKPPAPPPRRNGGRRALASAAVLTLAVAGLLAYPQILGPDFGAPVMEFRERLWPGAAPDQRPPVAGPESVDDAALMSAPPDDPDRAAAAQWPDTLDTRGDAASAEIGRTDPTPQIDDRAGFDVPASEASRSDTPAPDAAVGEAPAAETPVIETPVASAPASDGPLADTPAASSPVADAPVAETPPTDQRTGDAAETAGTTEPTIAQPTPTAPVTGAPAPAPQVSFTESRIQVPWNAPAALVQLQRTGSLAATSTVRFEIEPGLAEPDEDFITPADNRVRFGEGENAALIVIPLVQRTDNRGTRSLWLTLIGDNIDPDGIREVQVVLMNDV